MRNTLWEKIEAKFAEMAKQFTANPAATGTPAAGSGPSAKEFADLRAEFAALVSDITGHETTISGHATAIAAKDAEIGTLKAEIAKLKAEAKTAGEQTIDAVAAQGIPTAQLPAAAKPGAGQTATASLRQQYKDLCAQGDSAKAGEFYMKHRDNPDFWK